jgi:energy-converting hydrogenase A subunit M
MIYSDKDFEGMLLNVYPHKLGTDLFKKFPILDKYSEFKLEKKSARFNERVIRYVVYSFDRNSPLTTIDDVLERRFEAIKLAGFDLNKGIPAEVDMFVKSLNSDINNMVIRYCIIQSNTDYMVLVTYEDALFKELARLLNFDTDDEDNVEKKKEIIDNIVKLRTQINSIRSDMLSNNVDMFLSKSLTDFSEAKRIDLSPEAYAKMLKSWNNVSKYYKEAMKHK